MPGAEFPHGAVTGQPGGPTPDPVTDPVLAAKRALRTQVLAARRALDAAGLAEAGERIAEHVLRLPEVRAGAGVAAYVSGGTEPPTDRLLEALAGRGVRVLLPVLLEDDDLDWAVWTGASGLVTGRRGLREPDGPRLGVDAVAEADLVLVPGLAVSTSGHRMGRGGGSYDRALARVGDGVRTAVLLHPGEVGLAVPVEAHDRPVDLAVTRDGVTRLR